MTTARSARSIPGSSFIALIFTIVSFYSSCSFAHHSAALFYDSSERITLTGEVAGFKFSNPHAILELLVKNDQGEIERWTCETSAPSALRRRGWSQESIMAGEIVTLEGVPARDGSLLMRITSATKADGTQVGVSRSLND